MPVRILIIVLIVFISEARAQKYPYTVQADVSLLIGDGVMPVPGVQISNGIKIKKWSIEPEITIGADVYRQFTLMPVSAGFKWVPFSAGPLMPYFSFNTGYGLSWFNRRTEEKSYRGGSVVHPSLGLRIKTKGTAMLNFSAGYKQQRSSILETVSDNLGRPISVTNEKYKFSRITLSLGVGFSEIRLNSKPKLENIP